MKWYNSCTVWHRESSLVPNCCCQIWGFLKNKERNALRADHFRPSVRPSLLLSGTLYQQINLCWHFMKSVVGILYRELWIGREFGEYERWRGHSVVMTCKVKPCHILEVKNAYSKMTKCAISSSAPRTDRRCGKPNLLIVFNAGGCKAGVPFPAWHKFFSTFAKLQTATISFVMSVRLSVHMEQHGFQWTDFK